MLSDSTLKKIMQNTLLTVPSKNPERGSNAYKESGIAF
jgi:hypothetical protein